MNEAEVVNQISPEMAQIAERRARERARTASWDLDVALFFFSISILIMILVIQKVGMEWVTPSAIGGLFMGWLVGRLKRHKEYKRCYAEELLILQQQSEETGGTTWKRLKDEIMKELGKSKR